MPFVSHRMLAEETDAGRALSFSRWGGPGSWGE